MSQNEFLFLQNILRKTPMWFLGKDWTVIDFRLIILMISHRCCS